MSGTDLFILVRAPICIIEKIRVIVVVVVVFRKRRDRRKGSVEFYTGASTPEISRARVFRRLLRGLPDESVEQELQDRPCGELVFRYSRYIIALALR